MSVVLLSKVNTSVLTSSSNSPIRISDSNYPLITAMTAPTATQERYDLITRRLQEVLGGDSIKALLDEGKTPKCYWGAVRAIHAGMALT